MSRLCFLVAVVVADAMLATTALAQPFPSRALRIVVPYAPGGPTDILARAIGQKLTESWGQPVVIENRPGAAGMTGTAQVAKAPADGYTLVTAGISFATAPSLDPKLPVNPLRDFAPVALMGMVSNVVVVHPSLPVRSVRDLVSLGRTRPGQILYASGGSGGTQHLSGELFRHLTGVKIEHVPYRGSAPGLTALIAGEVALGFTDMMITVPHVRSGKLRGLAVTGPRRSALLPDLPTVAEAGVTGYAMTSPFGLVAPAGTPGDVIAKLKAEVVRHLGAPDMRDRLASLGAEAPPMRPEEYGAFLRSETDTWARVIRTAGIRGE
jgi:tripartite-type tricarboxylate transporter receptor subunit TctC